MKKGFSVFSFILFLCLLCSCTESRISDRLDSAESYLSLHRDSALSVLNSINEKHLKGKSLNARHALLKLQALEGYDFDWEVPDSSDGYFYARPMMDSLTDIVTHFYIDKTKGSEAERMKAYYYAGVKLQYDSIYPGAIQNINHSLDMARELQDTLWIGKNAIWLADIYCNNMHVGEA